ncbi:hypothetical protein [Roseateles sp.]|uniref:hypothetical protein n=1 Tax=Roseateles sp. TaxID=1971397 RepID=UPI002DFCC003|nr:hypothetical protein [Roseateles sp.]
MSFQRTHRCRAAGAWLAAGLLALAGAAQAAGPAARNVDPLRLQYEREKADCLTGRTAEPRNVCLREAAAAYAQARQGKLVSRDDRPEVWAANALKRCDAQHGEDRDLCRQRVEHGHTDGSVAGGGQITSLTVRSTDVPASPGR